MRCRPSSSGTVHPRIRGERRRENCIRHGSRGSSPHTRGTLSAWHGANVHGRFIPAYAGNACAAQPAGCELAVHPRIRGERAWGFPSVSGFSGSSPHTRGTPTVSRAFWQRTRFIPAYAGNANAPYPKLPTLPVHPRIRGERVPSRYVSMHLYGSSPHTRGTHGGDGRASGQRRFIPAYAGNAARADRFPGLVSVHPRIRGERMARGARRASSSGSSPHTRGTQRPRRGQRLRERFIPAYAGNAHGQRRGNGGVAGSSPHTRGTPQGGGTGSAARRFIPAYAGNAKLGRFRFRR